MSPPVSEVSEETHDRLHIGSASLRSELGQRVCGLQGAHRVVVQRQTAEEPQHHVKKETPRELEERLKLFGDVEFEEKTRKAEQGLAVNCRTAQEEGAIVVTVAALSEEHSFQGRDAQPSSTTQTQRRKSMAVDISSVRGIEGLREAAEEFDAQRFSGLSGYLWKKSPKSLRLGSYDWRYFAVRNMRVLWWQTVDDAMAAESARLDGGPLCKGFIDLMASECVMTTEKGDVLFSVKAVGGTWAKNALLDTKRANRIFTFDASGSEHSREKWMEAIEQQLKRATEIRQQHKLCNAGILLSDKEMALKEER